MVNIQQKRFAVRRVSDLAKLHGAEVVRVDHMHGNVTLHFQDLECRVLAVRGSDGYCKTRWSPKIETTDNLKRWQVHAETQMFGAGQVKPQATTELLIRHLKLQLEWLEKNPFSLLSQAA